MRSANCVRIIHVARRDELTPFTPNYLALGHVTRDITPTGYQLGGTVSFATRAAQACGWRAALLTSAGPRYDVAGALPDVARVVVPAAETTTFENIDLPDGRRQILHGRAAPLRSDHVPAAWRHAELVHLAPVADELDPHLVTLFAGSFVGVTPQGWMRRWDTDGQVVARPLQHADAILPHADAVILSAEDLPSLDELARLRRLAVLLILTRGCQGCTLFRDGGRVDIPAPVVEQVSSVGAGDIFAATFFIQLQRSGDPIVSAEIATRIAAHSVTGATFADKMRIVQDAARTGPVGQHVTP